MAGMKIKAGKGGRKSIMALRKPKSDKPPKVKDMHPADRILFMAKCRKLAEDVKKQGIKE